MALKSDLASTLKSIASSAGWSHENDRHMEGLNMKIAVYEKQIADLQNKLAVLETAIPIHAGTQLQPFQDANEKQNKEDGTQSVDQVTAQADSNRLQPTIVQAAEDERLQELQQKLRVLELENAGLKMKITEKDNELAENRELLRNIYAELKHSSMHKKREVAEHPLS